MSAKSPASLVIGVVLIVIALVVAGLTVREFLLLRRLRRRGLSATGTVIEHREQSNSLDRPVIRFADQRGHPIEFVPQRALLNKFVPLGETFPVAYLPDAPQKARLSGSESVPRSLIGIGIFSLIFFVPGLLLVIGVLPHHSTSKVPAGSPMSIVLFLVTLTSVLALLAYAVWRRRRSRALLRDGVATTGRVTRKISTGQNNRSHLVEFLDSENRRIQFLSTKGSWRVGDEVPVTYLPDRPHDAKIGPGRKNSWSTSALASSGIPMARPTTPTAPRKDESRPQPPRVERISRRLVHFAFPWNNAKALFKPAVGEGERDRLLDRLGFWRSTVGLLTVAVSTLAFQSIGSIFLDNWGKSFTNLSYGMYSVPVLFVVLYFVTRPKARARVGSGLLRLLRRAGLALLTIAGPIAVVFLIVPNHSTIHAGAWTIAIVLGICWYAAYFTCTVYWASRTFFWISEIHPLLAPVGSGLFTTLVSAGELIGGDSEGLPRPFWISLNLCGLVTTLVLAVVEYRHLRSKRIGWTTGPDPEPASTTN